MNFSKTNQCVHVLLFLRRLYKLLRNYISVIIVKNQCLRRRRAGATSVYLFREPQINRFSAARSPNTPSHRTRDGRKDSFRRGTFESARSDRAHGPRTIARYARALAYTSITYCARLTSVDMDGAPWISRRDISKTDLKWTRWKNNNDKTLYHYCYRKRARFFSTSPWCFEKIIWESTDAQKTYHIFYWNFRCLRVGDDVERVKCDYDMWRLNRTSR